MTDALTFYTNPMGKVPDLKHGRVVVTPAFKHYWAGIANRPAKQRADAIDNALMPPRV